MNVLRQNLSPKDSIVRMILGVALLAASLVGELLFPSGVLAVIVAVVATTLFLTGWMRFCPIYHAFGVNRSG
jgi:hypothetical protein